MLNDNSNSTKPLNFPVPLNSDSPSLWILGNGFDPVTGRPTIYPGFNATTILNAPLTESDQKSNYVSTDTNLKMTLDYVEKAHGSGWGASTNDEVKDDFSSAFDMQHIVIWYYAYKNSVSYYIDRINQKLSPQAAKDLNDYSYSDFCNKYGTHFIYSTIKGSGLSLLYKMKFLTIEAQNKFSNEMSASYKGFGAKASVSEQLQTCLTASHSEYSVSTSANAYGFDPPKSDWSIDDMKSISDAYFQNLKDYEDKETVVQVTALPWYALEDVRRILDSKSFDESLLGANTEIADVYRSLSYIQQTATYILEPSNKQIAGSHQQRAITNILNETAGYLEDLTKLLNRLNSGKNIDDSKITQFSRKAQDLTTKLTDASREFAVSWSYQMEKNTSDYPKIPNYKDGQIPSPIQNSDGTWTVGGIGRLYWSIDDQPDPKSTILWEGGDNRFGCVNIKEGSYSLQIEIYNPATNPTSIKREVGGNVNHLEVTKINDSINKMVLGPFQAMVI